MKQQQSIDIEHGYRQSYMDKNLFMLGLQQLIDVGVKSLLGELKRGVDSRDFWRLRTASCSLKEIADYHGAHLLSAHCASLKDHADRREMDHIYPLYAAAARELLLVRRCLVKYIRENKGEVGGEKLCVDPQFKETGREDEMPLAEGYKATFKPNDVSVIDLKGRTAPPPATVEGPLRPPNCCTIV